MPAEYWWSFECSAQDVGGVENEVSMHRALF